MECPEDTKRQAIGRWVYWLKRLPFVNFFFYLIMAQADLDNLVCVAPATPTRRRRRAACGSAQVQQTRRPSWCHAQLAARAPRHRSL